MVFVLRALERVSSPSEGKRRVRVGGGGRWRTGGEWRPPTG